MPQDLSGFHRENAKARAEHRRVPFTERKKLIHQHFPSTRNPDWNLILKDDNVLAAILRDVLTAESTPEKPADIVREYRELIGDYTSMPFQRAFRELARDKGGRYHSITQISRKTSISRTRVHRLITGADPPDAEVIGWVARAYGKKPAFFAEYRAQFVARHLTSVFESNPELSASVYRNLLRETS